MPWIGIWMGIAVASPSTSARLDVRVVDDAGQPVPTATVRVDDEGIEHRVGGHRAQWSGTRIYPQGQEPETFVRGELRTVTVAAPGHVPRSVKVRLERRRTRVDVPLQSIATLDPFADALPASPAEDSGELAPDALDALRTMGASSAERSLTFGELLTKPAPSPPTQWSNVARSELPTAGDEMMEVVHGLFRVRALAHHVRWQEAELRLLDTPTRRARAEVKTARDKAAEIAVDWLGWASAAGASTDLPMALCLAATDEPLGCDP